MQKLVFLIPFLFSTVLHAQTALGTWQTKDDETGENKSHVQIYEAGGKVYGKIAKVLRPNAPSTCAKCPGDRKDQPLLGMAILVNMLPKSGFWESGNILDPEKGKWYGCKMWLKEGDPNTLVVRGFLGPFYRTQYWTRVQ